MEERAMYMIDVDTMIKVYELAKAHGKIAGENIQDEFDEIKTMYPEKFKFMAITNMDNDLLLGNLREELPNKKILDMTNKETKND